MYKEAIVTGLTLAGITGFCLYELNKDYRIRVSKTKANAEQCIDAHKNRLIKISEVSCDLVKNTQWLSLDVQDQFKTAYSRNLAIKAEEESLARAEKERMRAEAAAKQKAKLNAKRAAEAQFIAEGWVEHVPGIFRRWCRSDCDYSGVIGDNGFVLMEVWARDRSAGDIYAKVNLIKNNVVVGWTNDTLYLSKGQRGVLTFDSYKDFDSARLVQLNVRG